MSQEPDHPDPTAARRAAEETLRRYELLAHHSRDIVLFMDRPSGRLMEANEAAVRAYGYSREELLALTIHDLRADETRSVAPAQMAVASSEGILFETVHRRKDGSTFPVEVSSQGALVEGTSTLISVIRDTTRRQQAEHALRQSEERLRLFIEHAPVALAMFDREMRYVSVSRRWLADYGLEGRDVIGQSHYGVFPEISERWREFHRRGLAGEVVGRDDDPFHRADGSVQWLRWEIRPWRDGADQVAGIVIFTEDISARKAADAALRASEERFAKAFHSNPAVLCLTRMDDSTIIDANPAMTEVFGYGRDEFLGKTVLELGLWPTAEDREAAVQLLRRDGSFRNRPQTMLTKAGDLREFLVSSELLSIAGERVILSTWLDITQRKRTEETLQSVNAQLAEADRRKDEFIAVLSHELRNPIAPIRYALPVLQAQAMDGAGRRAIAVIERQVDHLTRLVDDLLDVSRITRGKIELRKEFVTVGSAVTAAAEAASPAIVSARHRLNILIPEEPIWLYADAARISQVITNLLTNSARYTPRGGEIDVTVQRDDGCTVIRVRDNGIGIPCEALPAIFDMFTQVGGPDRSQGGLGIGLALVRQLVEMHNGTVEAHSAGKGRGAEFVVTLPIASDVRAAASSQAVPPRTEGAPLRVLIVDDNADFVEMLAITVENAGHEVRKALDGRSGLSAALSYCPDVVLLDLGLPVMSGLEVAKELRRHPETAGARLVALTGWGQAEDRRLTRDAGFEHHLTKPTDPQVLEQLLAEIASGTGPGAASE